MNLKKQLKKVKKDLNSRLFKLQSRGKEQFECSVCNYVGPFKDVHRATGSRKHAQCPRCYALERHRIQYLVVDRLLKELNTSSMKMLHFAPEAFLRGYFSAKFGQYETADLYLSDVDHRVDLQDLPFADRSYDFVFASHVLEHIPEDTKAISEIRRVLKPSGIAVLPVPLVAMTTIEYPEANPYEEYHVRAPGLDYFDRYRPYFSRIDRVTSEQLPDKYQLYLYEDRSHLPSEKSPYRPPMEGERFIDVVPICYT